MQPGDTSGEAEEARDIFPTPTVSLVPATLIELCDLARFDYRIVHLPSSVTMGVTFISLDACGWRRVGELEHILPLTLLTCARALCPLETQLNSLWMDAVGRAQAVLAPLLYSVLAQPLATALTSLAGAAPNNGQRTLTAESRVSYSALAFEPEALIEEHQNLQSALDVYNIWEPVETPDSTSSVDRRDYAPLQAPLLSAATRQSLETVGCHLSELFLEDVPLSPRTLNTCSKYGDCTLVDLASHTPEQLFARRNFGPKAFLDVVLRLRAYVAPWLARLPADTLLGGERPDGARMAAPHEANTTPREAAPETPFAALRNSDLLAVLDLYDVPWRDIPAAALVDHDEPLPDVLSPDGMDSSLEQANHLLADLMPLLAAYQTQMAWSDLTLGELIDATPARDDIPFLAALTDAQQAKVTRELGSALTRLLLRRVLRPAAWRPVLVGAAEDLEPVSVASLLDELFGSPDTLGRHSRLNVVELLYARHGLTDGRPRTLDALGLRMGVTRERVRQIEKRAYEQMENPRSKAMTRALGDLVRLSVAACGGVATLAGAAAWLADVVPFGALDPEATIRFLSRWSPDVTLTSDALLIVRPYSEALVRQSQRAIREVTLAHHTIARDDLLTQACVMGGAAVQEAGAAFVAAVIETMGDIAVCDIPAPGDDLASHRTTRYQPDGRGALKSRIVQTMRSLGRPAHFTEIAREYRHLFPEDASRTDNSVHAFFSRFEDTFVLVGNGTFSLAEWGYDPALKNIPTLVERILEESERPMRQDEVVGRAQARYRWKANSIAAQLSTNPRIVSLGDGWFGLRGRDYGGFDLTPTPGDDAQDKASRERLVLGTYSNKQGHPVVRLRLTLGALDGRIPLTNRPMRELFPEVGRFQAWAWVSGATQIPLTLSRTGHDVSGFRPLMLAARACADDTLFIERITEPTAPQAGAGAPHYLLAIASAGDLTGALEAVGLNAATGDLETQPLSSVALHYARKPYRIALLVEHTREHPWMPLSQVNAALGCVPTNPAGAEYLQLAQGVGMVATGRPTPWDASVARPTALGRAWAESPGTLTDRGRRLALSLPAYRAHVRSLPDATGAEPSAQRMGAHVLAAWDTLCLGVTSQSAVSLMLEQQPALISTEALSGPELTLLLLLLVAQTQGQGLSCRAVAAALGARATEALAQLRMLGLALIEEGAADTARVALAEPVTVALASHSAVEAALSAGEGPQPRLPLAQAWRDALRIVAGRRTLRISDLYTALQTLAPDYLYDALAPSPAATPEAARYVDGELPFCGFPLLAADWALANTDASGSNTPALETIVSYTCGAGRQPPLAPVGVALCDDLLTQPWDAERHLSGNAHLALLTIIAADEGGLAEQLRRSDAGWRLAGVPLIAALDALLRSLGYDPWDEGYRTDSDRVMRLGQALVTLAERLNVLTTSGARLEAVSGIATHVYYEACGQGFTDLVTAALGHVPAPV